MKMNAQRRLSLMMLISAMFVFVVGAALAGSPPKVKAHHHNSGHALAAAALKTPGTHQLDKKGKHTVSAETKGGKITSFHVNHETKGNVAVKKYKSKQKMASLDDGQFSGSAPAQTDLGTVYVAYAYVDDDGNEEYYWFPAEEIQDPDTGAITYVPLN